MISKQLAGNLKQITRVAMIVCIFLAVFKLGALYGNQKLEDQNVMDFFTQKQTYEWNSYEQMPKEVAYKVQEYNTIVRIVQLAVLLSFLVMFFDYFVDPENHFITELKNKLGPKLKKFNDNMGEDLNE